MGYGRDSACAGIRMGSVLCEPTVSTYRLQRHVPGKSFFSCCKNSLSTDGLILLELSNTWGECWTSHQIIGSRIQAVTKRDGLLFHTATHPSHRQVHKTKKVKNLSLTTSYFSRYHGQASGIFSCSEHLAGLVPSQVRCQLFT